MFDNVGKKIILISKIFCIIGIFISLIWGLNTFLNMLEANQDIRKALLAQSILIIILGSFGSWFSSLLLCGFGVLIDSAEQSAESNYQIKKNTTQSNKFIQHIIGNFLSSHKTPQSDNSENHFMVCPNCASKNASQRTSCWNCEFEF